VKRNDIEDADASTGANDGRYRHWRRSVGGNRGRRGSAKGIGGEKFILAG
jgi:hypothetical protein